MKIRDLGLLMLFATWIDTIAYSIYLQVTENLDIFDLENFYMIGRDPYLFLGNTIIFFISFIILIRYTSKQERGPILKLYWLYPLVTGVIALIYGLMIGGSEIVMLPFKAPFIPMYTFLSLLTVFLYEIKLYPSEISEITRKKKIVLVLTIELFIYITIRIVIGASPLINGGFLALAILTMVFMSFMKKL